MVFEFFFFFSSRRRHTRLTCDWSSDVCSSDLLAEAERLAESVAGVDPELDALAERLRALRLEGEDLGAELRGYIAALDAEPGRLEEVEARLEAYEHLERKHGGSVEAVLAHAERCRTERAQLESAEVDLERVRAELAASEAEERELAAKLGKARRKAAPQLAKAVRGELAQLAMAEATFEVALTERDELGPKGGDRVELTVAPNPGVPAGPLREIASGGELSRVMLALMSVANAGGARALGVTPRNCWRRRHSPRRRHVDFAAGGVLRGEVRTTRMAVPRTKSHTFRAPPPATVTHGLAQAPVTFSGRARLGKRTKHLVKRLGPTDIAVIDHAGIDRVAGEDLVATGCRYVINVAPSVSPRYANQGPAILVDAGAHLIDMPGAPLFETLKDGETVTVDGGSVLRDGHPVWKGTVQDRETVARLYEESRRRIGEALSAFAENTISHIRDERELLSGQIDLPDFDTAFRDRPAMIVVRG